MSRARCHCGSFYRAEDGRHLGCGESVRRRVASLQAYREMFPCRRRELLIEGIRHSARRRRPQLVERAALMRAARSAQREVLRKSLPWSLIRSLRASNVPWHAIASQLRLPKSTLIGWAVVEMTARERSPWRPR